MNQFGHNFRLAIWGESHGHQIGISLDGVPAGIPLSEEDFAEDLARRRSGAPGTTPRREPDVPQIVSGVYDGYTTGAPLTIEFANTNTHSQDYSTVMRHYRPSHADLVAYHKFAGFNDPRGGGHFSARLTVALVAAVPELTELTFYYMNLVTVSRVQRNPTVKAEIQMRNFEASIPVGFFCYPISQAADITAFRATAVPVGEDQLPMLEQCKEIVHKFNSVYGDTLTEPEIILPSNKACLRLPGIDGKAKMSKSLGNCIYLSDTEADVKKKVMSMFTDPNHLRVEDPGNVDGNPVFIYLDAFCRPEHFAEFLPDYQNLDELKAHYQRGGLGDVKVKKFLNNVMQSELAPIRERRKYWEEHLMDVYDILKKGSEVAEAKAAETLKDVKAAMKINYFEDSSLLKGE